MSPAFHDSRRPSCGNYVPHAILRSHVKKDDVDDVKHLEIIGIWTYVRTKFYLSIYPDGAAIESTGGGSLTLPPIIIEPREATQAPRQRSRIPALANVFVVMLSRKYCLKQSVTLHWSL